MSEQPETCMKCGGRLVAGTLDRWIADAEGGASSRLEFTIPGVPTSWNPIVAFKQGMAGEKENETFSVLAWHCSQCGLLEIYAAKPGQK